jgi:hypothetical protein
MTQREREELEAKGEQIRRELKLPILPTGKELALVEKSRAGRRPRMFLGIRNKPDHVSRKSTD